MKIKFVDLSKNLQFEKKTFYVLFSPFFLIIAFWVWLKKKIIKKPKINFYFFDGVSENCRIIKENATNWRALDIIYNYRRGSENFFADFWYYLRSSQATRNRLKIIKYLLSKNINQFLEKRSEVRLISLASGAGQGILETIAEFKEKSPLIKAVLIDLDNTALEHSSNLAERMGIKNQLVFLNNKASSIKEIGKKFGPQIIEMTGFLEYRPFKKAVELIKSIYDALEKDGVFIFTQIMPNLEMFFLKEVINWPMVYRRPREIAKILFQSNFLLKNCVFYYEPLKIHLVVEAKKCD